MAIFQGAGRGLDGEWQWPEFMQAGRGFGQGIAITFVYIQGLGSSRR